MRLGSQHTRMWFRKGHVRSSAACKRDRAQSSQVFLFREQGSHRTTPTSLTPRQSFSHAEDAFAPRQERAQRACHQRPLAEREEKRYVSKKDVTRIQKRYTRIQKKKTTSLCHIARGLSGGRRAAASSSWTRSREPAYCAPSSKARLLIKVTRKTNFIPL